MHPNGQAYQVHNNLALPPASHFKRSEDRYGEWRNGCSSPRSSVSSLSDDDANEATESDRWALGLPEPPSQTQQDAIHLGHPPYMSLPEVPTRCPTPTQTLPAGGQATVGQIRRLLKKEDTLMSVDAPTTASAVAVEVQALLDSKLESMFRKVDDRHLELLTQMMRLEARNCQLLGEMIQLRHELVTLRLQVQGPP